jgi:hypothetical protein
VNARLIADLAEDGPRRVHKTRALFLRTPLSPPTRSI